MWVVVPNLNEARDQLDKRFPNRDRTSDGSIGDAAHQAGTSSHNPDLTGSPEYRDGDSADEVRARDFDADLRDTYGVTMEQVVQNWVSHARDGELWWVRYIIFNGRIWHRRDNYTTRAYTGTNKHEHHCHVNSDFTNAADTVTGTNWFLAGLGLPKPTTVLKRGSTGTVVRRVQSFLADTFPVYRLYVSYMPRVMLVVDGNFGGQTEAWVKEFQRRTGLKQDGIVGPLTFDKMRKYGYKY